MSGTPRVQAAIVLGALALWAAWGEPRFAALVACYGAMWIGCEIAGARGWIPALSRPAAIIVAIVTMIAPLAALVRRAHAIADAELLLGIDHYLEASARLERTPSIAPALLSADLPQTYYVHAPGGSHVRVRLGHAWHEAAALGAGVFRVEHDPRSGGIDPLAILEVDGAQHERSMLAVSPLPHPRWLVPSPERDRVLCVSTETDEVYVIGPSGPLLRIASGDGPVDARFVGGEIVVSERWAGTLSWYDARGQRTRSVALHAFTGRLAVSPSGEVAVAVLGTRPHVAVVGREGVRARVAYGYPSDWLAFAGADLIASSVQPPALHRIDAAGERALPLGRPAVTMAVTPDGARVIVATTDFDPGGGPPHSGNHFVQDQLLFVDVPGWRVERTLPTGRRSARQDRAGGIDRGASPMGIDVLADGTLWIAFAGTSEVWRWAPEDAEPSDFALDDHPLAAPHGIVAMADGGFAVSSPSYGTVAFFDRAGGRRALVRLAPGDRELLQSDERALQRRIGERVFYESTRSGVSCQSCHLHAASDGALHNIGGHELVATLSVRGVLGTPPYLRDGAYPTLGSLDEVAQTLYRGYLRPQGGRRISLERYLEALPRDPPARQIEGRDLGREQRGMTAFARARCPMCHAPPAFTNLGQHPAQSIFPTFAAHQPGLVLDTPSLFGLGASAPYLVDGRATTLEEIWERHDPDHRHGDMGVLDPAARSDLFYLLEGL